MQGNKIAAHSVQHFTARLLRAPLFLLAVVAASAVSKKGYEVALALEGPQSTVSPAQDAASEDTLLTAAPSFAPNSEAEKAATVAALRREGGMILPKILNLVEEEPFAVYFRTFVPSFDPEALVYTVSCSCSFVVQQRRGIFFSPGHTDIGLHTLTVTAAFEKGRVVDQKAIELKVVPAKAGNHRTFQMLLIGDSLGHQSRFPNELAHFFRRPGNPNVTFVGTHRPAGSEIPHEQYGGWEFATFVSGFGMSGRYLEHSPFIHPDAMGAPVLDVRYYLDNALGGAHPAFVHIQLGINDAFGLDPGSPGLDEKLDPILSNAEKLVAGIRRALPDASISIGTVIQANASDRAFVESYPATPQFQSEWRWRRVQMRLAKRMMDEFGDREGEGILMIPTHLAVDPIDGYSAHIFVPTGVEYDLSNAVHPTPIGDRELAREIFLVLKAKLAGVASSAR